ncbi:MAG: hypothetical protein ACOYH4_06660 [Saccharofermentanales bacterium]|jgi:hypothetical protein
MRIDAIIGSKGTGKTPYMLEAMERVAADENANIVFIEYGRSIEHIVPYAVRRIDLNEYPVRGYDQLIAFLAGLNAKDYDITHIFIDSIFRVAGDDDPTHLSAFMRNLEALAKQVETHMIVSISCDYDALPEDVRPYVHYQA